MPFAAEQPVDRLAEMFPLEVPQGHVDGSHRGDGDRRAAKVHGPVVHFLPQPVGLERVLADEQLPQPAGNVVAERSIDDGLDDFGGRVRFADPLQSVVGAHAHEDGILATGSLLSHFADAENLTDHMGDFHGGQHLA